MTVKTNTAVLISIQPKWCELIATGKKTVEVRKNRPRLETPFRIYFYCTKGSFGNLIRVRSDENAKLFGYDSIIGINPGFARKGDIQMCGKVIGEAVCDSITEITAFEDCRCNDYLFADKQTLNASCLSLYDLDKYLDGRGGYAWHLSDIKIYVNPMDISAYARYGIPSPEELDDTLCHYCVATDYGESKSCTTPNGYWSCEGSWCEDAYVDYLVKNDGYLTRAPQSWCYITENN